jgi:CRP/FNR family transcriptional regulator, cyclic AMP receptor protein
MRRDSKSRRFRGRRPGTLFGGPIVEPPGHVSAHFPFPARLNDQYVAKLQASDSGKSLSKGAMLFEEGERPTGAYVVLEGLAKLSINSSQGKMLVLGFFGPGTIIGLPAAILGRTHAATAEIVRPSKILFVSCKELVRELQDDATASRQAAELASEACYFILNKLHAIDLSKSTGQKLARCLLGLLAHNTGSSSETTAKLDLSQEAIAQMIGLSRETVTRLLSRFRRKHILDWKRSGLVIRDRSALEKIADFSEAAVGRSQSAVRNSIASPSDRFLPGSQK